VVGAALALLALLLSAGAAADAAAPCAAEVAVEPERAFVGQAVLWRAEILRRSDVREMDWRQPPRFAGFRAEWLPGETRADPVERDGRRWRASSERRLLFPARSGRLAIPAAGLDCDGVLVQVPGSLVEVTPLPSTDRPAGFAGLVGPVRVTTRLVPERIALGQTAQLWILVRGGGNVWSTAPPLTENALPGVDVFAEPPSTDIAAERSFSARRTFRFRIVPRSPGRVQLPEVAIPWFDPETSSYRRAVGPARTLVVEGTAILGAEETP
jgi:hypothetical protein